MEHYPSALVIASYDSVCHDNNILYRLVRPVPDGVGVQSTDKLVNVVPFRRKYIFEKKFQLDEFGQQMLRRPLVLQPVLHFGRGFGNTCALSYQDELWLVMVNQTHPKILSRLQMGLDSAKAALARGQPFEIRFRFGKLIQRVYREHLSQKERGDAEKSSSALKGCMTHFRYTEWEHCDLNLRYHGYGAHLRSSALRSLPNLEMKWDFEDIGMHEMEWRQFNDEVYPRPHLSAVYEDEIRDCLPGWTINTISPLDDIGDAIPENNYDYAQAGRLYASFRKKRTPRNKLQHDANSRSSSYYGNAGDEEGAVGYDPSVNPNFIDSRDNAIEHNFGYHDADSHASVSQSRQKYGVTGSHYDDSKSHYQKVYENSEQHTRSNYDDEYSGSETRSHPTRGTNYNTRSQLSNQSKYEVIESQPDKYGHIHANVQIISPSQNQTQIISNNPSQNQTQTHIYDTINPSPTDYHLYNDTFKKQDSDRFSRSTNADSGYCPDGDEGHSRGGSDDYNEQSYIPRLKQDWQGYENFPHRSDVHNSDGLENPAFTYDDYPDTNSGLKKQQLVSKPMKDRRLGHTKNVFPDSLSDPKLNNGNQGPSIHQTTSSQSSADIKVPPRRKKVAVGSTGVPQVAESFI